MMRKLVIALGLAVSIGACGSPSGRQFSTTLVHTSPENPAGDYVLPVVLGDQTKLVTAIESAEREATNPGLDLTVKGDPTDPNAIIAIWLGGLCDSDATLAFQTSETGYALHLEVRGKLGFGCPAAGIGRAVRIMLSETVRAGDILPSGHG